MQIIELIYCVPLFLPDLSKFHKYSDETNGDTLTETPIEFKSAPESTLGAKFRSGEDDVVVCLFIEAANASDVVLLSV